MPHINRTLEADPQNSKAADLITCIRTDVIIRISQQAAGIDQTYLSPCCLCIPEFVRVTENDDVCVPHACASGKQGDVRHIVLFSMRHQDAVRDSPGPLSLMCMK